ncbi:hypothetical protein Bca52824_019295 [Brassica carinata]|uniref:Uncharacterized protein n=1 Tax=Brassica carinata TaxID=52824 RepID=A0A8X7VQI1_BRACI|nr:hypothetical protein Bca52824_019295 [Brassica carinata]
MGRLVRVVKGQWFKSQQGNWRFEPNRNYPVQDILVGVNDPVQRLFALVRGVFYIRYVTPVVLTFQLPQWVMGTNGQTFPPLNLLTDSDVELLMSVHDWSNEPMLFLVSGSEDVAKYQYTCRTPFTVGGVSFLGTGITEEDHISMVKEIIKDEDFKCSTGILRRLFTEEQMVVGYRFLMEVEKAKNSIDLNKGPGEQSGDHIVPTYAPPEISDVMMSFATPVNLETGYAFYERLLGGRKGNTTGGARGGGYEGVNEGRYYAPTRPIFHGGAPNWDNLMSSRYATELNMIYGVPGSENVGYPSTDLIIGAGHITYQHEHAYVSTVPQTVLPNGETFVGMMNTTIREGSSRAVGGSEQGYNMGELCGRYNEPHEMVGAGVEHFTGGSQNCLLESDGETSGVGGTR